MTTLREYKDRGDYFLACLKDCAPDEMTEKLLVEYNSDDLAVMTVAFGRFIASLASKDEDSCLDFADWAESNDCYRMLIEMFKD